MHLVPRFPVDDCLDCYLTVSALLNCLSDKRAPSQYSHGGQLVARLSTGPGIPVKTIFPPRPDSILGCDVSTTRAKYLVYACTYCLTTASETV